MGEHSEGQQHLCIRNINSFIWNVVMIVYMRERERDRWRTTIIDTKWWQTYSVPCFFHGRFDTEPTISVGPPGLPSADLSTHWLLSEWLTTGLSGGGKTSALYICWTPTHFSFWLNSTDSFLLSLVYTGAYPVLKSLTNRSVKGQYVTQTNDNQQNI